MNWLCYGCNGIRPHGENCGRCGKRFAGDEPIPDAPLPALLTRDALAHELSISPSCLAKLRREGLPTLFVAGMPRFELAPVLEWLRARSEDACHDRDPESSTEAEGAGSPE